MEVRWDAAFAQTGAAAKNAVTLADAPGLKPGPAPDQGAASNVGWSSPEEAVKHGASFIKNTYSKGDASINNYEYGFNVATSKGSDGSTVFKWGTIMRGAVKSGDYAGMGAMYDFHTHTLQSDGSRKTIRYGELRGLASSRDYVKADGNDVINLTPGSRGINYIGNSDSFRNGRIYGFSISPDNHLVSREIDIP